MSTSGVKKRMSECHLRLEAARYEAEKVVTQLLRDHEAWAYVPREARRHGKQTEAEPESR